MSSKWDPPMWFITIKEVKHKAIGFEDVRTVDGFFVLRSNLKALYKDMGYLDIDCPFDEYYGEEK